MVMVQGVVSVADASYQVDLPNFPDWAVPMTRVVPILTVSSAFDKYSPSTRVEIYNSWKKVDATTYVLTIDIFAVSNYFDENDVLQNAPMKIDIDLVIVNERNYFTTQTDGK